MQMAVILCETSNPTKRDIDEPPTVRITGRHRQYRWSFHDESSPPDVGPRSVVDFFIAYEFKNRTLAMVIGAMFDCVFHKYADAFVKRAGVPPPVAPIHRTSS
jgi:ribosome-associated toxin RatA of RatAB toxin-antitoxin module